MKSICGISPELEEGNGVTEFKSYLSTPAFSKVCVSDSGNYAVGSYNGDIRLYCPNNRFASCKFEGLGDSVEHL